MTTTMFTLTLLLLAAPLGAQEIYKWKDAKGQWRFSDTRPDGDSEKLSFRAPPPPPEIPKELPCTPFEPGDTRAVLAYDPGVDSPVRVEDVHMRRLEGKEGTGHFSWKLVLQNGSNREVVVRGVVSLKDCSELLIAEEKIAARPLAPFETVTVNGTKVIYGAPAEKVGRFSVQVGAIK